MILLVVVACTPSAPDVPACAGTHRPLALNERTPPGFTAEQVLAFATGTFDDLEDVPDLTVDVVYDGGRILACDEGDQLQLNSTRSGQAYGLLHRLDIEVEITLDGQPARTFLSADHMDGAFTSYELDYDGEDALVQMWWEPGYFEGYVAPDLLSWRQGE